MSGLINKAKELMHPHSHPEDNNHGTGVHDSTSATHGAHGTHGTHNSPSLGTDSTATHHTPKVDQTGFGQSNVSQSGTTSGPHSSNAMNRVDPYVDSSKNDTLGGTSGGASSTTGTHIPSSSTTHDHSSHPGNGSNLLEKLDPRTPGYSSHSSTGPHSGVAGTNIGSSGLHGSGASDTFGSGTHSDRGHGAGNPLTSDNRGSGQHTSHIPGTHDHSTFSTPSEPRSGIAGTGIGSHDRSHLGHDNTTSSTFGSGQYGSSNLPGSSNYPTDSSTGPYSGIAGTSERSHGLHNTGLNALDRKVDTGLDNDRHGRDTTYGDRTHRTDEGEPGSHRSHAANIVDPTIDSGRAYEPGRDTIGRDDNVLSNTGPAPTTAGPHKHDLLNKLDPFVKQPKQT